MSATSPEAFSNTFGNQLARVRSVPTEWQRSKSHLHRSSIELLTSCLPYSSSATSSGYWEDYESIGASAHEIISLNQHPGVSRHQRLNRSCLTVHSVTWPTSNTDPNLGSEPNEASFGEQSSQIKTRSYYQNTFGSFDYEEEREESEKSEEEEDRPKSPRSVMVKVPAPTIQLNLSTELLHSQSQSHLDLVHITTVDHSILAVGLSPVERLLPRQHSAPTPSKSLAETTSNEGDKPANQVHLAQTGQYKRGQWCSSCDASDSEEDGCDSAGERPEPRTLFEAALRRARLADSQREVNLNAGSKSGRVMPDWGSPIHVNRRSPAKVTPTTADNKSIETGDLRTRIDTVQSKRPDSPLPTYEDGSDLYGAGFSSPLSCLTEQHLNRARSPDTLWHPRETDWCTGIETWLSGRPRWLYQTRATDNAHAFQLCYLNDSDGDMWSDSGTTKSDVLLDPNEPDPYSISLHAPGERDQTQTDTSSPCFGDSIRGTLFRDVYEYAELNARLQKAEQYCDLYFKQRSHDCTDAESERKLNELHEKCQKTQQDVHFSLAQASKIAHMQLEVEKPSWTVVSPRVAEMLQITVKPRTTLPVNVWEKMNCAQLQLVVEELHNEIQNLNNNLMDSLMERDDLHLEHGAKMIELDDLLAYLKELCIRVSIRQYRRQLSTSHLEHNFVSQTKLAPTRNSVPNRPNSRSSRPSSGQFWTSQPCARLTLKQRLVSAFSRQNSTTC
ncbi:unnamed protein product [Echinostoma caproni]|uniref:SCHIP-1 domain-containing protein n=1 Tax=Echinostoma caproni TaxID=27848 RepID=A0A183A5T4_9TREM|nr:unnamed protein product [Echinostoma caproni]